MAEKVRREPKIWIFSEFYYPSQVSTGHIITKIAEHIAKKHSVNVICNFPFPTFESKNVRKREIHNNVNIFRYYKSHLDKNKLIQRALKSIVASVILFFKGSNKIKKNDIIIIVTNPALLLLLISILSKFKKAKLVVLVHDIFPDNAATIGLINKSGFFYKILNNLFKKAYKSAFELVVIGRDMKEILQKKLKRENNITFIPNWSDEHIQAIPKHTNSIVQKYNLNDKFILLFAGNLGKVQALDKILGAIKLLQKQENIHFVFAGHGTFAPCLQNYLNNDYSNITYLGKYTRQEQNEVLNASDVSIVALSKGMAGFGVPSKTYNILASGKPILGIIEEGSEIAFLIKEHQIGWLVPPIDSEKIAKLILEIFENKNKCFAMGAKARKVSEQYYSSKMVLELYDKLIDNIITNG